MLEQKRLGDNGTSAATAKESGDRGDEMDEKDGQVAHLAIVPISTSVTRLGYQQDLCDTSEFATHRFRHHRRTIGARRGRKPADHRTFEFWVDGRARGRLASRPRGPRVTTQRSRRTRSGPARTLLRLKELETLEKMTEKIDKLTVYGGLEGVLKDVIRTAQPEA